MTHPLGHPDNEQTKRAPLDAVMLAQAMHRGDDSGQQIILKNCDPYSVAMQACGFLLATFREGGVNVEERLAIWLAATRRETGEADE
jgi:hypothetical protein